MGERRDTTRFIAGVAVGAAACAVLTTGVLGGTAGLVGAAASLVRIPTAAADELPAFEDCEQLREWYVDEALPHVGPWGFGGGPVAMFAEGSADATTGGTLRQESGAAGTGPSATGAVGSSSTGTNVQEASVDESDVAKTDGRLLVRVVGDELVVTDVSGSRPRELSRTALPGPRLSHPELLLRDRRVVLVGDEAGPAYWGGTFEDSGRILPSGPADSRTHLLAVDLDEPAAPRVTSRRSVDGGTVSMREYADGTVRVVVTTGLPPLDFVQPNRDRSPREAARVNREVVRSATIDDWLPGVRTADGEREPLVDCSDVRHPRQGSGFGTISVLSFPFADPERSRATSVAAAGDLVYSSAERLYVATTVPGVAPASAPDAPTSSGVRGWPSSRTEVHAFALDGARTSYVASGSIDGTLKDRWSLDEHDGRLRVAVALGGPHAGGSGADGRDNGVLVLDERGDRLVVTGRVEGLGKDEDIQSVRWFGDLAVVVTFRQIDPLYTVDLSTPERPRVVGALKIPGFSSYLHPVGDDLLVGVGHDVDPTTGTDLGAQAATFDLSRLSDVRRVDTHGFGLQTDTGVSMDPRTFSYLPEARILVTPVQDWSTGSSRFEALRVGRDGSITPVDSWTGRVYAIQDVRTLPLGAGRIALVGDTVRLVDVR